MTAYLLVKDRLDRCRIPNPRAMSTGKMRKVKKDF
jgi:hypothetical protein